jgi:hypothetical protein
MGTHSLLIIANMLQALQPQIVLGKQGAIAFVQLATPHPLTFHNKIPTS